MSKHTPFIYISARNLIRSFQSKSKFEIGFNLSCARFYAAAMTETEPNVTFQWQTFGKKFFQHLILRFRLESRGHLCRFHGPLPWSWRTKARKKKKKNTIIQVSLFCTLSFSLHKFSQKIWPEAKFSRSLLVIAQWQLKPQLYHPNSIIDAIICTQKRQKK